jgi:hypothetical protein
MSDLQFLAHLWLITGRCQYLDHISPNVKQPWREAAHAPPYSDEVENVGTMTT